MSNIEKLKQELILQKQTIEALGGQVTVANTHPSPAEITQGISTIDVPDLTISNATENDVLYGKTFFSGSDKLKVGTYNDTSTTFKHVYEYEQGVLGTENSLEYHFPTDVKTIRPYNYYKNTNKIKFVFHSGIEAIGNHAFNGVANFTYENFNSMNKLKLLPESCFYNASTRGLDLTNFPPNLETIQANSFYNALHENSEIYIHDGVKSLGSYSFSMANIFYCNSIRFAERCSITSFGSGVFENTIFNCDLTLPPRVSTLTYKFFYNGAVNNVIMPENLTTMYQYCFGAADTTPLSDLRLRTMTFLKTTPPSTFYDNCFPTAALGNGFKIYVPDESIEAYKNKMATYASIIYPVSQKN